MKTNAELSGDKVWDTISTTMRDLPVCCCKMGEATELRPYAGQFCPREFIRRLRGVGFRVTQALCRIHDRDGYYMYDIAKADWGIDLDVATLDAIELHVEFEIKSVRPCKPIGRMTLAMSNCAEMTDVERRDYGW